jgi:hypothetical protein
MSSSLEAKQERLSSLVSRQRTPRRVIDTRRLGMAAVSAATVAGFAAAAPAADATQKGYCTDSYHVGHSACYGSLFVHKLIFNTGRASTGLGGGAIYGGRPCVQFKVSDGTYYHKCAAYGSSAVYSSQKPYKYKQAQCWPYSEPAYLTCTESW